jgi:hypothetical protein
VAGAEKLIPSDGPDIEGRSDSMCTCICAIYFCASIHHCQSTFASATCEAVTAI